LRNRVTDNIFFHTVKDKYEVAICFIIDVEFKWKNG
jgi:hypothetical protein